MEKQAPKREEAPTMLGALKEKKRKPGGERKDRETKKKELGCSGEEEKAPSAARLNKRRRSALDL